jgi:hypothetical protein
VAQVRWNLRLNTRIPRAESRVASICGESHLQHSWRILFLLQILEVGLDADFRVHPELGVGVGIEIIRCKSELLQPLLPAVGTAEWCPRLKRSPVAPDLPTIEEELPA